MPPAARFAAVCLLGCVMPLVACGTDGGGPSSPIGPSSAMSLPFVRETTVMRYYYEAGDTVEVERQEAYNA